jgi:hypothetical protein
VRPRVREHSRTDRQAAQLREQAGTLDTQAVSSPGRPADECGPVSSRLREIADKHDRGRITRDGSGT